MGSDVAADRCFRLLYRGLFRIGDDFEPRPDLVESWQREGPLRYLFVLKRGVRFSNGSEVTAADAAFTLNSIVRGSIPSFRRGDLDHVASIKAVGRYELELTLDEPFTPILSALNVGIIPGGTDPDTETPVGCGPYELSRWVHGQWIIFKTNPFAVRKPASPTIAFKIIPDPVVRGLELRRGSVDMVVNDLPPDSLSYFRKEGFPIYRSPGSNYAYLGINCRRKPLNRIPVRRAIALAIDRKAILKNILDGFGRPATGLLVPGHWAYNGKVDSWNYDPLLAEKLLDKAGLKRGMDGVRFSIDYKTSDNKVSRRIATAIAEYLAGVGIKVRVRWLEWGTFYGDVKRGNFDIYGLTWVGITDPDAFRLRFASWAVPPDGFNRGGYSNAEVDELLARGVVESDRVRRKAVYSRVQAILARELPYISLWYPDNVCVTEPGVRGVKLPPDANFSFLTGVRRDGFVPQSHDPNSKRKPRAH